jgi:hypothetical protein
MGARLTSELVSVSDLQRIDRVANQALLQP